MIAPLEDLYNNTHTHTHTHTIKKQPDYNGMDKMGRKCGAFGISSNQVVPSVPI
jgi:hypothetical protein